MCPKLTRQSKSSGNQKYIRDSFLVRFFSSFYYISSVARYEARILWRSWLFRIFSVLILSVLILFDLFGVIGLAGSEPWTGRYIPGGVFYMNFYLFTVAQVVIAAFLSADFLGRERKMDTTEVFYTRPMSNVQYVLGKTWGALVVFMGLNLVVALLGLITTFVSPDTTFSTEAVLFYLFAYSLPSLVFILGFSFLLMVLIRNQAVTFVVVLGVGGLALFYLQHIHWGVWDFIGFYQPAFYSGFSGFSDMERLLSQRGGYSLIGLSGILLTAFFLPRLSGSHKRSRTLFLFCLVFLAGAVHLFYHIISDGLEGEKLRERIRQTEKLLPAIPSHSIDSCRLIIHHKSNNLEVDAEMMIREKLPVDTLLLQLNIGFDIATVEINHQEVSFSSDNGILAIILPERASSDTSLLACRVKYMGHPDQEGIYPNIEEKRNQLSRFDPLIGGKEHAFVQSDYVLLTREAGWYPQVAWRNFRQQPDFTKYSLQFSSEDDLNALSQGDSGNFDGQTHYFSETPLNALTLIAGHYKTDTVWVDGVEYSLSVHKDNDLFSSAFYQMEDTLPAVIRDLKQQYERKTGVKYPFQRLKVIEVPLHFYTYLQPWRSGTDHIQPEIILLPEYGGGKWFLDVANTHDDFVEEAESRGEEVDEQDIQTKMMVTLAGNLFLYPRWTVFSDEEQNGRLMTEWNRLQIFPLYFYHAYQIREEGWPVFQIMMEEALREKGQREKNDEWRSDRDQYKGLLALREKNIYNWLKQDNAGDTIARILKLRGVQFFSEMEAHSGQDNFVNLLEPSLNQFKFQNESLDKWIHNTAVEWNLANEYSALISGDQLPAFRFGNVKASFFRQQGKKQFLISVEVANEGNADGTLSAETSFLNLSENRNQSFSQWAYQSMEEDRNQIEQLFVVKSGKSVRIKMVFDQQPREIRIYTGVARNIPPVYSFYFDRIEEDKTNSSLKEGVEEFDFDFEVKDGAETFTVDNEDPGFSIATRDEVKTLKDWWLKRQRQQMETYESFNYWRPQAVWTNSLGQTYHGTYLRSAVLKASGNGNDKALWKCALPESGRYEVQAFIPSDLNVGWRNRNSRGRFHYAIHHANGIENAETWPVRERNGWVSLGRYFFDKGEAVVELSDKSEFPYVVADAVKWIRLK